MIKHYMVTFFPGSFLLNEEIKEVKKRERPAKLHKNCVGFYFFDRTEIKQGGEILAGERKNISPTTFIGRKLSAKDVEESLDISPIGKENMRTNGWKACAMTIGGMFPLEKGDTVELE